MATIEEQRRRHDLYDECRATFTAASADELMAGLPPPGWRWDDVGFAELRAEMAAGFTAMESTLDARFSAVEKKIDASAASLDRELAEGLHGHLVWTGSAIVGSGALISLIVGLFGRG